MSDKPKVSVCSKCGRKWQGLVGHCLGCGAPIKVVMQ